MQKEDYIMREIEKIGMMLQMIINKLIVTEEKLPSQYYSGFKEAKEGLENIGLLLDEFLQLDPSRAESYLMQIEGMKGPNLELLGDLLKEMGMRSEPDLYKACLEKALNVYEICNSLDKTYSFERDRKINELKDTMNI